MIVPTATDLLRCVSETLRSKIEPVLTGSGERSAAATVQHLLRFAVLRLEREGQVLCDDIAALRQLLADFAAGLRELLPKDVNAIKLVADIEAGLTRAHRPVGAYPTLDSLAAEAGALREVLSGCQRFLHARSVSEAARLRAQREAVKRYIVWQIEQETSFIEPAFAGHGPRR